MDFNNIVLSTIYNNLPISDLLNCSLVNKKFNKLFNNDIIWEKLVKEKYNNSEIKIIQENYKIVEYKSIYKKITDISHLNKKLNLNKEIVSLINLEDLCLLNKQLKEIPKEIGSLINLRWLNLANNQLKEIPKEIGSLINLERLYLYDNQLKEIPKEIGSLINLRWLNLANNQLKEIPKEIGSLINLERLYLYDNQLKEIPKEIFN